MPRKKTLPSPPSLFECSALATCQLVEDSASSVARVPELERKEKDLEAKAVERMDHKCTAIAKYLKLNLPQEMLLDLAEVYLTKLCRPCELTDECLDQNFEAFYAMCAFLKGGLREFSLPRRLAEIRDAYSFKSTRKYCGQTTWSLFQGIVTNPDFFTNLKDLDLEWFAADLEELHQLLRAITQHGKELSRLRLSLFDIPDSLFSCFAPRRDANGEFVGPVPCPKLTNLELPNSEGLSIWTIADFLLSHPMLTHLEWCDLYHALLALDRRILHMPEVFGEWKSNLTHADIITEDEAVYDFKLYAPTPGSISRLIQLFPKVTVLVAWLDDHEFLTLVPWMQRLTDLDLDAGQDEEFGRNAVALLTGYGGYLRRIRIFCHSVSLSQLVAIGQSCSNVAHFYQEVACVTGSATGEIDDVRLFENLETADLSIGGWSYGCDPDSWSLPAVLRIMLKDKPRLEKFTLLTIKNNALTDDFISEWVDRDWSPNLREVQFGSVESVHPSPGCVQLTESALERLMTLPKISKIGDLADWSLVKSIETHRRALEPSGFDLELVWK